MWSGAVVMLLVKTATFLSFEDLYDMRVMSDVGEGLASSDLPPDRCWTYGCDGVDDEYDDLTIIVSLVQVFTFHLIEAYTDLVSISVDPGISMATDLAEVAMDLATTGVLLAMVAALKENILAVLGDCMVACG